MGDTTHAIAVIGDGVAGAAAVVALAANGLPPLWLRPSTVSPRARVGESLAPAARPILRMLGLEKLLDEPVHRASRTTFSAWGTPVLVERSAAIHLEGPGMVLDRAVFEAQLQSAARDATDSTHRAASLIEAHASEGIWTLTDDTGQTHRCRAVVDATGRARAVARGLTDLQRADRLVALYAFLEQRDDLVEPTRATLIESTGDGWWYASLLADRRLALNYYTDPDLVPSGATRDVAAWSELIGRSRYIAHWLGDADFTVAEPPRMASAGTTWSEAAAGVREGAAWMAIGDAAAAFDPLSSHGMTTALWGAAQVPTVLDRWLHQSDADGLSRYARTVASGVAEFLEQRRALYARERRFADHVFWTRRL